MYATIKSNMKFFLTVMVTMCITLSFQWVLTSQAAAIDTCGVETAVLDCGGQGGGGGGQGGGALQNSGLWSLLIMALNIMTGLVGILAVGGIVYGAIMYTSAQDNSSQVQEAVGIIRNVIIGIVLYAGMFVILQYLIPGGIFNAAAGPPTP